MVLLTGTAMFIGGFAFSATAAFTPPRHFDTEEVLSFMAGSASEPLPERPLGNFEPTPPELLTELGLESYAPESFMAGEIQGSALPSSADLTYYLPPVGYQKHNDCAAFSLAYYGISYWNFRELGIPGNTSTNRVGSSPYLYNQTNGGEDNGLPYLVYPFSVTRTAGSAFESDFSPSGVTALPDLATQMDALPQRTVYSGYLYNSANLRGGGTDPVPATGITAVKQALAAGNPVIVGFFVYESFYNLQGTPAGWVYEKPTANDSLVGGHAITIAGYYDDPSFAGGGCFLLRNSWSTYWGSKGEVWVTYDFIQKHSIEAYAVTDEKDHVPSEYIVLNVDHPHRGDLDVQVYADGTRIARYSPWIFDNGDSRDDLKTVIDLTGLIPITASELRVDISDKSGGSTGTILQAYLATGGSSENLVFSSGKSIPDNGSRTGVLSLDNVLVEDPTTADNPANEPDIEDDKPVIEDPVIYEPENTDPVTDAPTNTDGTATGGGGGGGCDLTRAAPLGLLLLLPLSLLVLHRKRPQ